MRSRFILLAPSLLSACFASSASPPAVQAPVQPSTQLTEYVLRAAIIREDVEPAFKVKERGFSTLDACDKRRVELDPREIFLTCVPAGEANG